jgi:hypothetical protein
MLSSFAHRGTFFRDPERKWERILGQIQFLRGTDSEILTIPKEYYISLIVQILISHDIYGFIAASEQYIKTICFQ